MSGNRVYAFLVTTMNDDFMLLLLDWFIRCFSHASCVDICNFSLLYLVGDLNTAWWWPRAFSQFINIKIYGLGFRCTVMSAKTIYSSNQRRMSIGGDMNVPTYPAHVVQNWQKILRLHMYNMP